MMGFLVIPAKHGKEGVKKAVKEKPDLILMDIMVPGMDGWEATVSFAPIPTQRQRATTGPRSR